MIVSNSGSLKPAKSDIPMRKRIIPMNVVKVLIGIFFILLTMFNPIRSAPISIKPPPLISV